MKKSEVIVVSGMWPGITGAGRFLTALWRERKTKNLPVRFFFGRQGLDRPWKLTSLLSISEIFQFWTSKLFGVCGVQRLRYFTDDERSKPLILIHFHALSPGIATQIIEEWKGPIWIYLIDSSFFCFRSYNHVPQEAAPCLKCVGGNFQEAQRKNCRSWPYSGAEMQTFLPKLREWVARSRISLIAQNQNQAALAFEHFGPSAKVILGGLWTADWADLLDGTKTTTNDSQQSYDVVFHGAMVEAKGATWAVALSARLPQYRFFFPFEKMELPREWKDQPLSNCEFRRMSWETGLKEIICSANLTLHPSLWSAPIEGALVKSLAWARATAIVKCKGGFAEELSDDLVLRLDSQIDLAAQQIERALITGWRPSLMKRKQWAENFVERNHSILDRLVSLVNSLPIETHFPASASQGAL